MTSLRHDVSNNSYMLFVHKTVMEISLSPFHARLQGNRAPDYILIATSFLQG